MPKIKNKEDADWFFNLCASEIGLISFIKKPLSVYRIHSLGAWSKLSSAEKNLTFLEARNRYISMFQTSNENILSSSLVKDISRTSGNAIVGEIYGVRTVVQEFKSNFPALSAVSLKIATYKRSNTGYVKVEIIENGYTIRESVLPCDKLIDNCWATFKFSPIEESLGKDYSFRITSSESNRNNSITTYYDSSLCTSNGIGKLLINKTVFRGSLCFETYYLWRSP